jgi:uncharacterized protein (DUF1919 family)
MKKSEKGQVWEEAKKKHHLSNETVRMAQALGLNPKKIGKIDNHKQEPWKDPLPIFIERLYEKQQSRIEARQKKVESRDASP